MKKFQKILTSNLNRVYLFKFLIGFHLIAGVLVPFFTGWGGLTLSQTMLIQSWFLVWSFLLEIPTGAVADYLGRKQSLFFGALVGVIAALVYSSAPLLPIFLLGEFLFATSFALFSGADEAFLYDTLKAKDQESQIKKVLGRYQSIGLAALMVAAPIGSYIGSSIGPRFSMMLMSAPFTLAFLVGITLQEPPKEKSNESTRYLDIIKDGFGIIKNRRKIQWIALDIAVVRSLSFIMIWLYQPLLSSFGIDIKWFGIVHTAFVGVEILIMNSYPRLDKILSTKKLLVITAIIPGLLFVVSGVTTHLPIVLLSIVLLLGFGLTRQPLVSEELNNMIPRAQRATVLSTLSMLGRAFSAGLLPAVGKLADWSLNSTLVIIGVVLLLFAGVRQYVLSKYQSGRK